MDGIRLVGGRLVRQKLGTKDPDILSTLAILQSILETATRHLDALMVNGARARADGSHLSLRGLGMLVECLWDKYIRPKIISTFISVIKNGENSGSIFI